MRLGINLPPAEYYGYGHHLNLVRSHGPWSLYDLDAWAPRANIPWAALDETGWPVLEEGEAAWAMVADRLDAGALPTEYELERIGAGVVRIFWYEEPGGAQRHRDVIEPLFRFRANRLAGPISMTLIRDGSGQPESVSIYPVDSGKGIAPAHLRASAGRYEVIRPMELIAPQFVLRAGPEAARDLSAAVQVPLGADTRSAVMCSDATYGIDYATLSRLLEELGRIPYLTLDLDTCHDPTDLRAVAEHFRWAPEVLVTAGNEIPNNIFPQSKRLERLVAPNEPDPGRQFLARRDGYVQLLTNTGREFRRTLGDERVKLVVEWFSAQPEHFRYVLDQMKQRQRVDALAVNGYFGHGVIDPADMGELWAQLEAELAELIEQLREAKRAADEYGVELYVYEGLHHLWASNDHAQRSERVISLYEEAVQSPRMGVLIERLLDGAQEAGVDLFCLYSSARPIIRKPGQFLAFTTEPSPGAAQAPIRDAVQAWEARQSLEPGGETPEPPTVPSVPSGPIAGPQPPLDAREAILQALANEPALPEKLRWLADTVALLRNQG